MADGHSGLTQKPRQSSRETRPTPLYGQNRLAQGTYRSIHSCYFNTHLVSVNILGFGVIGYDRPREPVCLLRTVIITAEPRNARDWGFGRSRGPRSRDTIKSAILSSHQFDTGTGTYPVYKYTMYEC